MKKLSIIAVAFVVLLLVAVSCRPTDTQAKIEELEEKISELEEGKGQEQVVEETKVSETAEEEEISSEETTEEGPKEFSPNIIGSLYISGFTTFVHIVGDYAYVGGQGLSIIDITDKTQPTIVGSSAASGFVRSFHLEGDYAYLPFEEIDNNGNVIGGGFQIIDITDKISPIVVGTFEFESRIGDIAVIDNYIYAVYEVTVQEEDYIVLIESGIKIIDMADKTNLVVVGEFEVGSSGISSIYTEGDLAYIIRGESFSILDITDRKNPITKGSLLSGWAQNFYIEGDFAYLPSGNSLQIIDITDKANPTMVGGSFAKGDVTNVFVVGDNAYITYTVRDENYQTKESGIQIIDITNKSAPVVVTGIETPGETLGLFVEGDYAYIGAGPV